MSVEEKYLRRCIQLAQNGRQNVPPNPMVGAVIVCDGKIIGEGYHVRCGEGHAEVNAVASVRNPALLERSTLYVSLEPCSHYGKTPPCADLIVNKHIPRVVVGCLDPFFKVSGRGVRRLRDAGVEVVVGVLEQDCLHLNDRFITFQTRHRPYVTLKWAESADGFIDICRTAGDGLSPAILSTPLTQLLTHRRRAEHQAILVGRTTALLDNPSLTVRHWTGRNPLRVVIDRAGTLPPSLHLFDGTAPTLVFTENSDAPYRREGVTLSVSDFGADILPHILGTLYGMNVQSLLVEGGSRTLQSFIDAGLWDEAYVEHASAVLTEGVHAPSIPSGTPCTLSTQFGITYVQHRNLLLPTQY